MKTDLTTSTECFSKTLLQQLNRQTGRVDTQRGEQFERTSLGGLGHRGPGVVEVVKDVVGDGQIHGAGRDVEGVVEGGRAQRVDGARRCRMRGRW